MADDARLDFESFGRHGGQWAGREAESIVVRLRDGGKVVLPGPISDTEPLTPMQESVMEVIEDMTPGDVFSNEDFAEKSGYANTGAMRDFIRKSARKNGLRKTNKGWHKSSQKT